MLFNTKFDLVISLGEDCACSSYLRRFKLQDYSFPFDWLTKANFRTRIDLICTDFAGFLNLQNLEIMAKPTNRPVDKGHDYYKNAHNDFYFYHDFPVGIPLEQSYPFVKAKYDRRIHRMYRLIKNAQSVLFVWWGRSKTQNLQQVEEAYLALSARFPKQNIFLLLIEPRQEFQILNLKEGHILVYRYDNLSYTDNETMGNVANNEQVFRQIVKKFSIKVCCKKVLYKLSKIPVEILPMPTNRRKKLRQALKEFYFKEKL